MLKHYSARTGGCNIKRPGRKTAAGPLYQVRDHLGSVVYELNAATGARADGGTYGAWGDRTAVSGSAASATSR